MKFKELKDFLEEKVQEYNADNFIETDPIQIPHQFSKNEDIEIIALLVSTIAWGNRTSIIKNGNRIVEIMQGEPYEFIKDYNSEQLEDKTFVHRTFNIQDLDFFFRALQNIYKKGGLEKAFSNKYGTGAYNRIIAFREAMLETDHESRVVKHLSNPAKNSSAKRLNMFLRWMVRKDSNNVDFGIWNSISPSEVCLPLDVHTGNIARKLGILARKQNDWKALEEIMTVLRKMDPDDPCKYDYALFGLGAFEKF